MASSLIAVCRKDEQPSTVKVEVINDGSSPDIGKDLAASSTKKVRKTRAYRELRDGRLLEELHKYSMNRWVYANIHAM